MQSARQIRIRQGRDLRLAGAPRQALREVGRVDTVALMGHDFPGIRPEFRVAPGDRVKTGQTLFVDRRRARIAFAAPAAGVVEAINRGQRRALDSLIIRIDGGAAEPFGTPEAGNAEALRGLLLSSGLWTSFAMRPFGRIPDPDAEPGAIFVTAIDTSPLAADPRVAIDMDADAFRRGLAALPMLTAGPVFVCRGPGEPIAGVLGERINEVAFSGPHPAGLAGTHIHHLAPAGPSQAVWTIGYQDVIAIGTLLQTGRLPTHRVVALAGPGMREPALARLPPGSSLDDALYGQLSSGDMRLISGSVLTGRESAFLSRYHNQVTVLPRAQGRYRPGAAAWLRAAFSGVPDAAIIPREDFERVLPFDILPVPLLRALSIGDAETARDLGCLELVEEDLALLSHVCTTGTDYGALLRFVLDQLEAEG
ncbi:MAG: NADH:ubiquinone reductase (Na(+)-transporting) subunit A [Rhizobiaceae bacterium]|nr:NADH:ubiquinone reductase (Na(+)-transporting) subunit A [Rhizobiaceae bacterium]